MVEVGLIFFSPKKKSTDTSEPPPINYNLVCSKKTDTNQYFNITLLSFPTCKKLESVQRLNLHDQLPICVV